MERLLIGNLIPVPIHPHNRSVLCPVKPLQVTLQICLEAEIFLSGSFWIVIGIVPIASVPIGVDILHHFDALADGAFIDLGRETSCPSVRIYLLLPRICQGDWNRICILPCQFLVSAVQICLGSGLLCMDIVAGAAHRRTRRKTAHQLMVQLLCILL